MEIIIIPTVAIAIGIYSYKKAHKNRMAQAVGFALIPGLWFGALAWAIITGQFGALAVIFFLISVVAIFVYLSSRFERKKIKPPTPQSRR